MKKIALLFLLFLTSCVTSSTLRTARVLEFGEVETSGGVAAVEDFKFSPVVITGVGVGKGIDLELRYEDQFIAVSPRLQITRSECAYIDCLTFFEVGYSEPYGLQWGPGVILGRRISAFEPYLSYRYRHFSPIANSTAKLSDYHALKCGTRLYLSHFIPFFEKRCMKLFIDGEVGPTIKGGAYLEWAVSVGFGY